MNILLMAAAAAATNIVVEASRIGSSAEEMPAEVQVITRDEIAASGAKDLPELLERKASQLNIVRQGCANPALASIAPAGYGENGYGRLLVLVDGQRLNNIDMSAPDLTRVALGSVERVEVISGSSCVLYGDAASGGLVNIITTPEGYENHGRAEVHGGSWGTIGGSVGHRGGLAEEGLRYWANGSWDHSDGYRDNSGYDIWNVGGGLQKDFENGSFVRLDAFYNHADYDLAGYLMPENWKADRRTTRTPDDWYRRWTWGLNAVAEGVINDENRVRLTGNFTHGRMHTSNFYDSYEDHYDYDLYSYALRPEWINTTSLLGLDNEFIAGAEYRYDRLHRLNGTSDTRAIRNTMAFFAQDTLGLTDELAVQLGGRYQRVWNENTLLTHTRRNSHLGAFDAALNWTPVRDLKAYVRYSRFFRNPFMDENPYLDYAANSLLDPEWGDRVDVGFDYRFPDGFYAGANLFVIKTYDEIMYDKVEKGTNINSDSDTLREGFTLRAGWERDRVAAFGIDYTYTYAVFDGGRFDGRYIPMVPKSLLKVSGKVWLWDDLSVSAGWRYLSHQYAYSDFDNEGTGIDGYSTFYVGAQYRPTFCAWLRGFTFGVMIDNLFDKTYADCAVRSSGGYDVYYPAAGRSFMFTVSYEW